MEKIEDEIIGIYELERTLILKIIKGLKFSSQTEYTQHYGPDKLWIRCIFNNKKYFRTHTDFCPKGEIVMQILHNYLYSKYSHLNFIRLFNKIEDYSRYKVSCERTIGFGTIFNTRYIDIKSFFKTHVNIKE